MRHAEFRHHRLVPVYDAECRWGPDDDFFQTVVDETPAARVLDLGCGTGRLTIALAAAGHTVTGVDPADASVAAARAKPGGERVTWLAGTSALLPERAFDVAVLTSHVAQFFVDDAEWARTLADLARALVPGGRLVFDARDPADRRWERWNPVDSHRLVMLPDGGEVRAWTEVTGVRDGVVDFTHHYHFDDGEELLSSASLRFRTEAELRTSLTRAGFIVDRVHGGWHGEPVGHGDGEFVVLARVGTLAPVF
ncbi:class I SAM-dependent methyltransferase [Micromonospora saelicesensis]|uniref:Demethylmenaquinone methyltransferase n=1 Tax=Micromonospora saelicesensis TaxID=285676 RepID=A0A1C4ZNB6_9ACTN|nr:class I SAM-dependent methyltransferase [Micromonospora saelicesensis]RAN96004.1 Demethylmenaquinone methyltransferase [Micromonospora saelicesensis]SCF34379.1 Methyltransferase domain-containing protein [Micromonospora saelicesensis]